MSRQRPVAVTFVVGVAAALAIVLAWAFPATYRLLPFYAPDSASYLAGEVGRTPAYPLLLRIVPLGWLGAIQFLALTLTAAGLAIEAAHIVGPALAVGLELAILGNVQLMAYAFTVLPEAFFVSAEHVQLALALRLARCPTRATAAAIGGLTAVLILLKPSGYSFLVPVTMLPWLMRRPARTLLIPAAATIAGVLVTTSAINIVRWGAFGTQAYGGYATIGYVAQLLDERTPTAYPDLSATIIDRTATTREELNRIGPLDLYYMASSNAYHDVLDTVSPAILEYVRRKNPEIDARAAFVRLNDVAQSLAVLAIVYHPLAYAAHAGAHLYGLWFIPLIRNRAEAAQFKTRLDRLAQTAPYTMRHPLEYRVVPPVVYWPIKSALVVAFIASLAGLVLVLRPAWAGAGALAYAAVALHANFLLVSAVQTGLPRYALAMWPTTMLVLVLGVSMGTRMVKSYAGGTRSQAP